MALFPTVRGSAIDGHGWSVGDAWNPSQIIELEVVTRDGIEPSTHGISPLPRARLDTNKSNDLEALQRNSSSQHRDVAQQAGEPRPRS